jgi:ribosome maturation factor RimP
MLKERITDKLNEYFEGSDLFLVDVKASPQDKITVFVDAEKNIPIERCVEISRMLEEFLEQESLVRENYILEVSSPGMDQPLKVKQQYVKAIGRQVEVLQKDGIKLEGILKNLHDDGGISLQIDKMNKGKLLSSETVEVAFEDIKTVKKLITFK